tara:strand:- start:1538 stop:2017 length:480 start_codon:yes stop_codon:yes gene_type:complete
MRKIKSAPANLCEMVNNKKEAKTNIKTFRFVIPIMNIESTIILEEKSEKKEIINRPAKYEEFKTLKTGVKKIGSLTSDVIGDSNLLPYEQTTLLTVFINYLSENVLKKDKLKEIYTFALQAFVRYLIMLFIHSQLLHDELGKNVPLLDNNIINEIGDKV